MNCLFCGKISQGSYYMYTIGKHLMYEEKYYLCQSCFVKQFYLQSKPFEKTFIEVYE